MRAWVLVFVLLLIGRTPAEADETKRSTFDVAADKVIEAITTEDADTLSALARADAPDPWIVADALLARGAMDAAMRFAEAAPRKDTEALPAYVSAQTRDGNDGSVRDVLARARAAFRDSGITSVATILKDMPALQDNVVSILLLWLEGITMRSLDRPSEAAKAYAEAGARADRVGWYRRAGMAFEKAGVEASTAAEFEVAISWFERARAAEEARENRKRVAAMIGLVGAGHLPVSEYGEAEKHLEHARTIYEDLGDRSGLAWCLNNLGTVSWRRGDLDEAIARYTTAFDLHEQVGNDGFAADVLGNIGLVHESRGDFKAALDVQQRALARKAKRKDPSSRATTQMAIGIIYWQTARYAEALEMLETARATFEAIGERANEGKALNNIGLVLKEQGNYVQARENLERAIEVDREVGDRQGMASSLIAMGGLHRRVGDIDAAQRTFEEALRIFKDVGAKAEVPTAQSSLGLVLVEMGRDDEALELFQTALRGHQAAGNRSGECTVLRHIALIHRRRNEPVAAHRYIEDSIEITEEIGDREGTIWARMELAECIWELEEYASAVAMLRQALADAEQIGQRSLTVWIRTSLSERLYRVGQIKPSMHQARLALDDMALLVSGQADETAAKARGRYAEVFRWGMLAAHAMKDTENMSYFIESSRSGALLEALGGRDAIRDKTLAPELRGAEDEARRAELAALTAYRKSQTSGDRREVRKRRKAVDVARSSLEDVVARIQREAKASTDLAYPRPDDLATIQSMLEPDELMILLCAPGRTFTALAIQPHRAWIVGVMPTHRMDQALDAALLDDAPHIDAERVETLKTQVRGRLLIPKATRRLLISPFGRTAYLPFALLFPEYEIVYVPSATTYGVLRRSEDEKGSDVLGLGDPDYGTHTEEARTDATRGSRLIRLPATRKEVEAIADVKLLGASASEAGLREALEARPRWRSVHFACHGLIDAERPAFSALALSADPNNDGFLNAGEVFGMTIPADLVVLSACETGKGRIEQSEGIMGLTRAFMVAGAPRVICSLWKVDDQATQALMAHFYERWNEGRTAATALKEAQAHVRSHDKWKHPYFWAAWVLWGMP